MPGGFAFFVGPSLFECAHYKLSTMYFYRTRYSFLICSTTVTVELGLLALEKVNSSFFHLGFGEGKLFEEGKLFIFRFLCAGLL